jgi:hypothetical protein
MKFLTLKYFLILCIAITLFLKVGNVLSYLSYSSTDIENVVSNDDATEKEEKKVETEYFMQDFMAEELGSLPLAMKQKIAIPACLDHFPYFADVLTPPPSV